jgi:hypothetical protein
MNTLERRIQDTGAVVVAAIFIALGVLFLLDEFLNISLAGYIWPFVIIVPGVLLYMAALANERDEGAGLAAFASIVTMVGLVLLVQNTFDLWATWAYAWALVGPTAVGLGLWLYGTIKNRPSVAAGGAAAAKVGLGLFIGFGLFFEVLLNISGLRLGTWAVPVILILIGVSILWKALRSR